MSTEEVEAEDEVMDPRLEEGWHALEEGDVDGARDAVAACSKDDDESVRLEALMLEAALEREDGNDDAAVKALEKAAKADPEWCTPELWLAELLFDDANGLNQALPHAKRAVDLAEEEDEYLAALNIKATIELALGKPTEARKTLKGLPAPDAELGDPDRAVDLAEVLIEAGDPAEAKQRLEVVVAAEPDHANAWYVLGVAAELTGDEARQRSAWVKTRELDAAAAEHHHHDHEGHDHDHDHLTEAVLVEIAEETLADLPDEIRGLLANVPVIVAELPATADVAVGVDPRVLGLFNGTPHAEAGSTGGTPTLTEIVLFRANIERVAHDEDELRDEIATTLLHEAGHFFGLDEAALKRLGLD
jgi:predicted Zn-dependent protease with MMP-like domain/Tfp pilus assembly protein PilF